MPNSLGIKSPGLAQTQTFLGNSSSGSPAFPSAAPFQPRAGWTSSLTQPSPAKTMFRLFRLSSSLCSQLDDHKGNHRLFETKKNS